MSKGHAGVRGGDATGDSYSMNFDASQMSVTVSRHDDKFTCPDCSKRIAKGKEFVHKKICKGAAGSGSSGKRKPGLKTRNEGSSKKPYPTITEELEVSQEYSPDIKSKKYHV